MEYYPGGFGEDWEWRGWGTDEGWGRSCWERVESRCKHIMKMKIIDWRVNEFMKAGILAVSRGSPMTMRSVFALDSPSNIQTHIESMDFAPSKSLRPYWPGLQQEEPRRTRRGQDCSWRIKSHQKCLENDDNYSILTILSFRGTGMLRLGMKSPAISFPLVRNRRSELAGISSRNENDGN